MGALTLDVRRYGRLLAKTVPKVNENEEEYERVLSEVERLAVQAVLDNLGRKE